MYLSVVITLYYQYYLYHESRYVDTVTRITCYSIVGLEVALVARWVKFKKKTLITKWQLIMARFVDISSRTVL